MKRILVIAGSDNSGGAGLEADQKVIAAHGCYAMTATTALTAQNTLGVQDIHITPTDFVLKQINACIDDIGVDVVKTGMLASASTVSIVARALREHKVPLSIVDPVMVSTSGSQLLPKAAVRVLCDELLPLTTILTPNVPEACLLLREAGLPAIDVQDLEGLKALAAAVHGLGPRYVLVKGGHLPLTAEYKVATSECEKQIVANVLYAGHTSTIVELPYQDSRNTHGTGCSLASAIACNLAKSPADVEKAVRSACRYVDAAIRSSPNLGQGAGPLNHFHSMQILPFAPGNFIDYMLERDDVRPAWHEYTHHAFVEQMGDGTLSETSYKHYMIQDYLYLIHFARANSLAGYKAKDLDDIAAAAQIVTSIRYETDLHIAECAELGITREEMEQSEESQACTAYTRYVLDIGHSEDTLALQISLLPCLLGYSVIAKRLHAQKVVTSKPNRYQTWIDNYTADSYSEVVATGRAFIEKHAMHQSPRRIEELVKILVHATRMETGFWEMASSPT
ncbi:trifunctional hydroxymethylpyrimidine kinase/phosphomethylpyrimidine kinase/thiaminase [Oleoguttula sp. CCFEE 5521]